MITFDEPATKFNYSVGGIAIHDNRVLLHRAKLYDFWFLPGGRGEIGESATETLRGEMREELAVDITVEQLVWVAENFFDIDQKHFHELSLYFAMAFPKTPISMREDPFTGHETKVESQYALTNVE